MISLSPIETALFAINGFGAMQKQLEFAALLKMLDEYQPVVTLEIGLGKGGSSWGLSKISSIKDMIAIDLPNGPWGGGPEQGALKYIADNAELNYQYIAGNSMSTEALEAVKRTLGDRKVDFLFIDGDHSYAGVKTDYLTYSPFVKEGGLIALHDICEHDPSTGCEVKKFWDELKESLPPEKYVEFIAEPLNWGGIGVVKI